MYSFILVLLNKPVAVKNKGLIINLTLLFSISIAEQTPRFCPHFELLISREML